MLVKFRPALGAVGSKIKTQVFRHCSCLCCKVKGFLHIFQLKSCFLGEKKKVDACLLQCISFPSDLVLSVSDLFGFDWLL